MSPLDGSRTQHQPGVSTSGQIRSESPEHLYQQALALYRGDYLEEYPYDEWCSEERERLLTLYLRSAERLARRLADQQRWEAVIDICQAMLARDDCWEEAYRLLMLAHSQLGNRTQAARAYLRCQERLRAELDVAPSLLTTELYQQVVAKDGGGNTL